MGNGSVLVVGGTSGIGREVARHYHRRDHDVTITGRDAQRTNEIASEIGAGDSPPRQQTDKQVIDKRKRPVIHRAASAPPVGF
jgi:NAD(P)-dependent dehydrogenase (short-subunit alcohol dehydrogenase family)